MTLNVEGLILCVYLCVYVFVDMHGCARVCVCASVN